MRRRPRPRLRREGRRAKLGRSRARVFRAHGGLSRAGVEADPNEAPRARLEFLVAYPGVSLEHVQRTVGADLQVHWTLEAASEHPRPLRRCGVQVLDPTAVVFREEVLSA
jgi:hypothetical protein